MENEIDGESGPLSHSKNGAGKNEPKMQKSITKQREQAKFKQLDVDFRALPADDMRKRAWVNVDKFSTTWVTAWPDPIGHLTNAELMEISTFYFGLPSPACHSFVGQQIGSSRDVVDRYGCKLTTAVLPGDGWRTQHDALKWCLTDDLKYAQVRSTTEVYGLFAPLLPQRARKELGGLPLRQRQGLLPYFMIYCTDEKQIEHPTLFELKTLHFGSSTYANNAKRCAAVQTRARRVHQEYVTKARKLDADYWDAEDGSDGPVLCKLRSFGFVRGLAFGAWGEASEATEDLLHLIAHAAARAHWRKMNCRDEAKAVGAFAWSVRRRWPMSALRENARLKIDRLAFVGPGAAAAACRRRQGEADHTSRARVFEAFDLFGTRFGR